MKKLKLLALCALAFICPIVSAQDIIILETYDQLANYIGNGGLFFVRDAAGIRTGQGGDPTVKKGYAVYLWDTGTSKWKMVGKEELLGINNIDFSKFMTTDMYEADQGNLRGSLSQYSEAYKSNSVAMSALKVEVDNITKAFDVDTVTNLRVDNERLKEACAMTTNIVIHTSTSLTELKQAVIDIAKALRFALDGKAEFKLKDDGATVE